MNMNVIFLDINGVLNTSHLYSASDIEYKVFLLSEICHEYDCKVVISSSMKSLMDPVTLDTDRDWLAKLLYLFNRYQIEVIGVTPTVRRSFKNYSMPFWKEDEIRLYLFKHPEVEHYCVIDDDDLETEGSDLNKVRDHLLKTQYQSDIYDEEGLLEDSIGQVGEILSKQNEIRPFALRKASKH